MVNISKENNYKPILLLQQTKKETLFLTNNLLRYLCKVLAKNKSCYLDLFRQSCVIYFSLRVNNFGVFR